MKRLVVPRSHFNLSGDAEGEVIANAGLVDAPLGELVLVTQTRRAIMKLENICVRMLVS